MAKCIYCKKANLKGYRQCRYTNQIKGYRCGDDTIYFMPCKHFKVNVFVRFIRWLCDKFYKE